MTYGLSASSRAQKSSNRERTRIPLLGKHLGPDSADPNELGASEPPKVRRVIQTCL